MKRTALLCSLIVILLSGCRTTNKPTSLKQNNSQVDRIGLSADKKADHKIVYLSFDISLTDSIYDEYSVKIKNKILAEGVLKKSVFRESLVIEKGYLYYELSPGDSSSSNRLQKIQNPLLKTYEYPGEDGTLNKQTFPSSRGVLTIRFQYENSLKSISIYKPDKNSISLKKIYYALL